MSSLNTLPPYGTNYPAKRNHLPKRHPEEKLELCKIFLEDIKNATIPNLDWHIKMYGISQPALYSWMVSNNLHLDYHKVITARRLEAKVDRSQPDSLSLIQPEDLGTIPNSIKTKWLMVTVDWSTGAKLDEAAKKVGWTSTKYTRILNSFKDELNPYYNTAYQTRIVATNMKRKMEQLENIELADDALKEKLKKRTIKEVSQKTGKILQGGRIMDVDNTTKKVKEVEPDLKAIEMVYKLNNMLKGDKEIVIELHSEVKEVGEFNMKEAVEIQETDKELLERIKKENQENDLFEEWEEV